MMRCAQENQVVEAVTLIVRLTLVITRPQRTLCLNVCYLSNEFTVFGVIYRSKAGGECAAIPRNSAKCFQR
jgi:hypothetical protein